MSVRHAIEQEVDGALQRGAGHELVLQEINGRVLPCAAKFNKLNAEVEGKRWDAICTELKYVQTASGSAKFTWFFSHNNVSMNHAVLAKTWMREYSALYKTSKPTAPNAWMDILLQTSRTIDLRYIALRQIIPLPVANLERDALVHWLFVLRHPGDEVVVLRVNQFQVAKAYDRPDDLLRSVSENATVQVRQQSQNRGVNRHITHKTKKVTPKKPPVKKRAPAADDSSDSEDSNQDQIIFRPVVKKRRLHNNVLPAPSKASSSATASSSFSSSSSSATPVTSFFAPSSAAASSFSFSAPSSSAAAASFSASSSATASASSSSSSSFATAAPLDDNLFGDLLVDPPEMPFDPNNPFGDYGVLPPLQDDYSFLPLMDADMLGQADGSQFDMAIVDQSTLAGTEGLEMVPYNPLDECYMGMVGLDEMIPTVLPLVPAESNLPLLPLVPAESTLPLLPLAPQVSTESAESALLVPSATGGFLLPPGSSAVASTEMQNS